MTVEAEVKPPGLAVSRFRLWVAASNGSMHADPRGWWTARLQALIEIVESGPIPAIHGVVRWRLIDLAQWLHEEFGVSLDESAAGKSIPYARFILQKLRACGVQFNLEPQSAHGDAEIFDIVDMGVSPNRFQQL